MILYSCSSILLEFCLWPSAAYIYYPSRSKILLLCLPEHHCLYDICDLTHPVIMKKWSAGRPHAIKLRTRMGDLLCNLWWPNDHIINFLHTLISSGLRATTNGMYIKWTTYSGPHSCPLQRSRKKITDSWLATPVSSLERSCTKCHSYINSAQKFIRFYIFHYSNLKPKG